MKNNLILFILIPLSLQSAGFGTLCERAAYAVTEDLARGPITYAGLVGIAALAYAYGNNPYALAGVGAASLAYHMPIAKSWWWLRKELRSYPDTFTNRDILKRTAWHNIHEGPLNTGFDIMRYYQQLNDADKINFANNLTLKLTEQNLLPEAIKSLEKSLMVLEKKIQEYGKFSNLYYAIKTAAVCDPLTTDYLFENNIHHPGSTVSVVLADHTKGSWIANSFKIRWAYSPTLGIAVPWWYTWSHRIASQCIVKALYQYGRLKAIRRILEIHVAAPNAVHDVNLMLI